MKVSHDVTKVFISFETNASLNGADSAIFQYLLFLSIISYDILTSSAPKICHLERLPSLQVKEVPIFEFLSSVLKLPHYVGFFLH